MGLNDYSNVSRVQIGPLLGLLILALSCINGAHPAHAQQLETLSVILTQPYIDTGLQVTPYETACTAIGQQFIAPGLSVWSLIGESGSNGQPFEVGTSLTLTAPAFGELYLGVNDCYYADNAGSGTATIALSPLSPQIIFENKDVTGATQSVVVGQQIALTAVVPGTAQSQEWEIHGGPVGGYSPTTLSPGVGELLPVSPINKPSVIFYWFRPTASNETFDVVYKYTTTTDDTVQSIQTTFSVAPPPTVTAADTAVDYGKDGPDWIFFDASADGSPLVMGFGNHIDNNPGITFRVTASPGQGTYQWVQLVDVDDDTDTYTDGQVLECIDTAGLDTEYPYNSNDAHALLQTDSPEIYLSGLTSVDREFAALMYLMWIPSTSPSPVPVPLGHWRWHFRESSSIDSRRSIGWRVSRVEKHSTLFIPDTQEYPTWRGLSAKGTCQTR